MVVSVILRGGGTIKFNETPIADMVHRMFLVFTARVRLFAERISKFPSLPKLLFHCEQFRELCFHPLVWVSQL